MPFKSEKQRRYLWMHEPQLARKWTDKYGSKIRKAAYDKMKQKGAFNANRTKRP